MNNDIKSRKRQVCENCGKIINPNTLICDACGTDYNEKPKCEHFYTKWNFAPNPINCSAVLMFKCEKCNEVITLNCSETMCRDMFRGRV